jgi:gas vesicle protein
MKTACEYVAAGIAIGAAVTVFFAPKSGKDTRKWIASKCLDGIEAANGKVWESRVQFGEMLNRGQRQISEVVAVGREAVAKNGAQRPVGVL